MRTIIFILVDISQTASVEITDTTTPISSDGSFTISYSSGTSPYTYSLNGIDNQESNTFENLDIGSYTVYIKDSTDTVISTTTLDITYSNPLSAEAIIPIVTIVESDMIVVIEDEPIVVTIT